LYQPASGYKQLHYFIVSVVLAPHGRGAIISIIPDFMSYNARRLGERGGLGAPQPVLPQAGGGAAARRLPLLPTFR